MKRICVIITIILLFLVGVTIYLYNIAKYNNFKDSYDSMKILASEISSIDITSMPSPPNNIKLDEVGEIKEFVDILNEIKLRKIENKEKENGWLYMIKLNGDKEYILQISDGDEIIIVNNENYKVKDLEFLKNYIKELTGG